MSVKVNVQFDGLAELEKALKDLRKELADKGRSGEDGNLVRNALNAAGRDVVKRQQAAAPEDTGRLKRSIFKKIERAPRYLSEVVYVGPRLGKTRADPNGAWYAAIVEMLGGEGGRGKGFMRNSINPEMHTAMIAKSLGAGIERVAKKIGAENLRAVGAKYKKA